MKRLTYIVLLSAVLLPMSTGSAKPINLKKFKSKEALCHYIEEKKEATEDRMKKGYKARKYDELEASRKYWKNLYVDKCF